MVYYPTDTVYYGGPYNVYAYATDASGIAAVNISYQVGNGAFTQIPMVNVADSLYTAGIPYVGYGKTINYNISAKDASASGNVSYMPAFNYYTFYTKYAQGGTVVVGTGTSNQNYPFKSNANNTKSASLYYANSINRFGLITQLKWNVSTAQASTNIPVKIYIKQVPATVTAMTADTWTSLKNAAVLVYDGIQTFTATGWSTIALTTPFSYSSGNLMVLCEANYGGTGAPTPSFYYSTAVNGQHQFFASSTATTGTINALLPNITIDFVIAPLPTVDAGISQITNPTTSVSVGTPFDLIVKVKNFGSNTLTKATVYYSIDGETPVSSIWTGSLNTDSTKIFTAANLNLSAGIHSIKTWTTLPNNDNDQNSANDTSSFSFYACSGPLNGYYTVGGSSADFPTFSDLFVGLSQCGINGPVVFYISPGTYSNQLTFSEINGASATNTVTFRSATNDSTSVIFNRASTAASNWIVKFNGADYITFKNVKFAPSDSANSTAIVYANGATNNKLIGCLLTGYSGTGANQSLIVVDTASISNNNNLFQGNYIQKGSYAISIKGKSSASTIQTIIKKNTFDNPVVYGIYTQYVDTTLIDSNTIFSTVANTSSKYGIYMQYGNHSNLITKNNISLTAGTNMYGILTENCLSTDATKGLIANNFVSITNGTTSSYGIRLNTTTKYNVYANSVLTNGTNVNTRALSVLATSSGINIINNNLQSNNYPIYVEGATSVNLSNYNNYFSTGTTFAYWISSAYANLPALTAVSLKDLNSISANPYFTSLTNLHTTTGLLKGVGTNLTEVTTDIDGSPRANPPCIGADEFPAPAKDAALVSVLKPIGGCGLSTTEDVKVIFKNVGSSAITPNSMVARYRIGTNPVASEPVNRTINPGDTIHYLFSTKANLSVAASFSDATFNLKVWADLTGDLAHENDSSSSIAIVSNYLPPVPTVTNSSTLYGTSTTLNAASNSTITWFTTPTILSSFFTGTSYTTPVLYQTTTYYVQATAPNCASPRVPIVATVIVPNRNAGISSIITPSGCALNQVPISVKIFNHGSDTLKSTNTTVKYKLDDGSFIAPEPLNVVINPTDTVQYTFNALADFSAPTANRYIKVTAIVMTSNDAIPANDSLEKDSILSRLTPTMPTANNVSIFYGTSTTLNSSSTGNISWFDNLTGGSSIAQGNSYTTPNLILTDTFYVQASNSSSFNAQVGTGTSFNTALVYPAPYSNYWGGTKHQMLIRASELTALGMVAGPISSIAFNVQSVGSTFTGSLSSFQINLKNTSATVLNSTSFETGLATVYGPLTQSITLGINTHTLTTAFNWDGFSNLLIQTSYSNTNNGVSTDYVGMFNTTTTFASTNWYTADNVTSAAILSATTPTSSGSTRPNIVLTGSVIGCITSPRVPIIVNVSPVPQNDAGVTAIVNPNGATTSTVPIPIKVKIKNFGQANLTSAKVAWKLNNILKPDYLFTGNVPSGGDTTITIANETFIGGLYCMKAWTKNPNGALIDSIPSNDSSSVTCFTACLNGVYTIGDTTGGNFHNYPTFNDAVTTLKMVGVCGNVTFLVDTGTYNEQVRIPEIQGVSGTNTITFRSASNDSTKVILQYNATTATNYYTLRLDSADYITFKGMTIKAIGNTYGKAVELLNHATYNTISNNIIEMPITTSSYFYGIYDTTFASSYNKYLNNKILNGYYGIYTSGSTSTSLKKKNEIIGNKILNFYYYGIYSNFQDSIKIIGNEINSNSSSPIVYGLFATNNNNAIQILKNKVILSTTGSQFGISINTCIGTSTARGLIANNMVALTGGSSTSTNYGLNPVSSNFQDFYHNSVNVSAPSLAGGRSLIVGNGGQNLRFLNNNIANTGGGYAFYVLNTGAVNRSNYNNIYSNGNILGYWSGNKNTLAILKAASFKDTNSVFENPSFTSLTDLHLLSTELSTIATPLSVVSDDIDGNVRDVLKPTIGAHERALFQKDAGIVSIVRPNVVETENDAFQVKVFVKNFGIDPITSMTVSYRLNNGPPVSFNYTGTILSWGIDSVTFTTNMTVPAGNDTICAYTTLTGDLNAYNNQICKSFWGTPLYDAQIATVYPLTEGCGLNNDTVKVLIANQGIMPINGGLSVSYQKIGSPTIVTEPVAVPIAVGANYVYKFNTLVNLGVTTSDNTYTIRAWATLTNDHYHANDTNTRSVLSLHTPASPVTSGVTIPYATTATLAATSATNDSIRWYGISTPSNALFVGSPYTTPILFATKTYYVEASSNYSITAAVGPISPTTHGGVIGTQTAPWNVNFTTNTPAIIKSVDIYPITAGQGGVIQVRQGSSSSGTLLSTINYTTNVSGGNIPQTVLINYELPTSGDYNLYMSAIPTSGVSWDTSASIYPYSSYVAKITGNGYNTTSFMGMYNWKFGTGCSSSKVPVIVTVGSQPTLDASVSSMIKPITAPNLSNNDTIRVVVKNYGSSSFSNFTMSYKIDNNAIVNQPVSLTTPLTPNDSIIFNFSQTANLSSTNMPQTFNIMAWVKLTGDPTYQNDTIKKTIINLFPPYCTSSATDTTDDDIGNVKFAGINNGNPLPVLNNINANKMYSDFTALTPGQIQPSNTYPISVSAIYSAGSWSGYCNVYIDYNRNGVFDLPSDLAFGGDINGTTASTITGTVAVPYYASAGLTRMRVVIRENGTAASTLPCGTYGFGETEDYTIKILPPSANDAGIFKIAINSFIPYSTPNPVSPNFYLLNFGANTLAQATINYTLNGNMVANSITPLTITPALPSLAIDTVNTIPVTLNPGLNYIVAWTSGIIGDTNIHNDTSSVRLFREFQANLPFSDNFDVNNYFYPTDSFNIFESTKNLWVQGVPTSTFPSLNAAHSPSKVWVTKLSGNYTANNTSFLYSPVFDISQFVPDTLRFWQWRQFGNGATGQIQYKNATGIWKVLGVQNDTNGINWYNTAANKWTGVDTTWKLCKYNVHDLTNLGTTLQFRFVFNASTTATLMKGWAIDDFDLTLIPIPQDGGVIAITTPSAASLVGANQSVTVTVKNFGTDPLSNIPVYYQVGSGTPQLDFVPGPILPGQTMNHTFSQTFVVGNQGYDICAWTAIPLGDVYYYNDKTCKYVNVNPASSDVGIVQILEPDVYTSSGSYASIKVVIKNYGFTTQTTIPLSYQRNNLTAVNDTFVGSIAAGATQIFTFAEQLHIPNGNGFFLSAYTKLNTDAYIYNDTLSKTVTICNVATAGFINGPKFPASGSTAVYTIASLQNATSYNWVYIPNPGTANAQVINNGNSATLIFDIGTIGGVLSVNGLDSLCSGTASTFIVNPVGIDEIDEENFWLGQNMPNPTTGLTNVEYNLPTSGEVYFSIMNLLGQKVYTFIKNEEIGKHIIDLNVSDLPAGFYYYTIEFKGKRLVKKMLINK